MGVGGGGGGGGFRHMRMSCAGTMPVGVGMDNSGTTKINH